MSIAAPTQCFYRGDARLRSVSGMQNGFDLIGPAGFGIANYPRGATFGPRSMRDFEFVWIVEGDAEYRMDEQVYPAPEGSIVLCRRGVTDFFRWDASRRTRHGFFHFDIRSAPVDLPAMHDWPVVVKQVEGDILTELFQHLLTWANQGDSATLTATISLMLRLFITGQRATHALPIDIAPDPVDRAITHLHQTLESDPATTVTLDDLAEAACVTPEHLCRVFKKSLDLSPMECVRLARLDRSVVLLSRSNFSIGQIATMCGFASQFHFARRFKESFGASPTQVRARVRTGSTPPLPKLLRSSGGIARPGSR